MKKEEIRALTGLRGIAALAVVFYHVIYDLNPPGQKIIILPGYIAVDLFFVLSGFVMALSYVGIFKAGSMGVAYKKFLKRRFARIYPLYIFLVILVFLLGRFHLLPGSSAKTLISNMFLIQMSGVGFLSSPLGESIIGPAWSISTEFLAYLLFPLLLSVAVFRSRRSAAVASLASAAFLVYIALAHPGTMGPLDRSVAYSIWPQVRCLAEFTLGLVTWKAWKENWCGRKTGSACRSMAGLVSRLPLR